MGAAVGAVGVAGGAENVRMPRLPPENPPPTRACASAETKTNAVAIARVGRPRRCPVTCNGLVLERAQSPRQGESLPAGGENPPAPLRHTSTPQDETVVAKTGVLAGEHSTVPIRRWFRPDGVGVKLDLTLSASELWEATYAMAPANWFARRAHGHHTHR